MKTIIKHFLGILLILSFTIIYTNCRKDSPDNPVKYWKKVNTPVNSILHGVFFVNQNIGYAVGESNSIIKTIDGGKNWTQQTYNKYANFTKVFFIDENTGWAVGARGTVVHTSDGGNTWNLLTNGDLTGGYIDVFNDVFFTDKNNGWVVAYDAYLTNSKVLKTVDGGLTWTIALDKLVINPTCIFVRNTNQVFVGGYRGINTSKLFISNDGGATWDSSKISTDKYLSIDDFAAYQSKIYLTTTSDKLFVSEDNGATWNEKSLPVHASRVFVDSEAMWVLGGGNAYSTDGGISWTTTTEENSDYVNDGQGLYDAFAIGKKAWGVFANGLVFYFE